LAFFSHIMIIYVRIKKVKRYIIRYSASLLPKAYLRYILP